MLRDQFTKSFDIQIQLQANVDPNIVNSIKEGIRSHAPQCLILDVYLNILLVTVPYKDGTNNENLNFASLIKFMEEQHSKQIVSFKVLSKDLEGIFNRLIQSNEMSLPSTVDHHHDGVSILMNGTERKCSTTVEKQNNNVEAAAAATIELPAFKQDANLRESTVIRNLFWKRAMHFRRNFRLILCMLILPTLFEILAMGFMTLRPPGEYDTKLQLNSGLLYPNSEEFYR